jgi:cytochrome c-type biogenesis protein CcmH
MNDTTIPTLKRQLQQLKELHEAGVLPQAQYDESKGALERRVLDLALGSDVAAQPVEAPKPDRAFALQLAGLAVGVVVVIAGAGYWWKGSTVRSPAMPTLPAAAVMPKASADTPAGTPHATNFDQIAAMTERLAKRMKDRPNDAEGWAMLARSYSVLGRHPEALQAYVKAVALRKDDATLLADYADALAVKNDHKLSGEPMKQVDRALKLDPRNLKALSLAGTNAFDNKDYKSAVKFWEQVIQYGPADNSIVQQVQPSLAEARDLAAKR